MSEKAIRNEKTVKIVKIEKITENNFDTKQFSAESKGVNNDDGYL